MDQGGGTGQLCLGGAVFAAEAGGVGLGAGGVKFNQWVALFDALPLFDVDGADGADLQGLNNLGAVAGDDLALGGGDDVDLAKAGPEDGEGKKNDDAPSDGAADGGWRGLLDLQRGG